MRVHIRRRGNRPAPSGAADLAPASGAPGLLCRLPFTEISIDEAGDVYPNCCPDWVQFPMGNLHRQSFDEVWNGAPARALRQSMLDGDPRFCDEHWCPHLQGAAGGAADPHVAPLDELDRLDLPPAARAGSTVMDEGPSNVSMNYDSSCNLACPTCRQEIRMVSGPQAVEMGRLHQVVEDQVLVGADTISMTGTGDPFASKFLRNFLIGLTPESHPKLRRVYLYTNAIMWTPSMWARMPGLHRLDVAADISIDAATAATYEVVRRPARWDQLMENLEFISTIPNLGQLGVNMTVSQANVDEVLAFYELACELASRAPHRPMFVEFKRVRRWSAHSDADWAAIDLDRLPAAQLASLRSQLHALEAIRATPPSGAGQLELRSNLGDLLEQP
ncbi:SPASM domain-containing protein [Aquihabitans sp. McL0605]|uniref:SPASM domain-containing protein n=1 Tax=Aquihabitans sp. McL0605 TaxID=3415671 RepID=UPI003CF8AFBD